MSSDNKSQALYTLVFDEIIRSPDLSDAEFRLYMIMLSYCTKKRMGGPKQCRLSQETMAGLMRGTDRQIRRLLRGLEDKKLIIGKTNPGNRYPTYDVATDPPPTLCPDELNSGMAKDALSYIREQGGAKTLQRKTRKKRKVIRPTGRPVRVEDAAVDVPADDRAPQALEDPSLVSSDPGQGCPGSTDSTPDKDVRVPGQGCPTTRTRMSGHPGQGCPPCTDVLEMSTSMTPYGVLRDRSSDLAEPSYTPSTSIADDYEGTFRSDIKMEDYMAESAEQREERLRRLKAKREGARSKITDIDRVIERPPGSGADPAPTPVG
ncbi:MAG: helix-turn-helix domain-containing protein, partial [Nitrospiraceae bacterium]